MPLTPPLQNHLDEHRGQGDLHLLPDHLCPDACTGGSCLFSCPVPADLSTSLRAGVYHFGRAERPGTICRHLYGLGSHNSGWWGEGEIKFYIDDDREFPTICGTGTEDYFCGSYNFDPSIPNFVPEKDRTGYTEFITPYAGLPQVIRPDGRYQSQMRFRVLPLAYPRSNPIQA